MNRLLKKRMLIISISLAFLLLINIGVSYSYYLGKVVGNESDTTIGIKSAGIVINYENNSDVIDANNVVPGWSYTKNFSISSTIAENLFTSNTSNLWYEIYLYIDRNDFPDNILTYSFSSTGNNVGNGLVAESRTNIGLPLSTELNVITIGAGNVAVGENVHNYSITFDYSIEKSNHPDCIFNARVGVKAIVNSVIYLNLNGGEIEGDTTKYVSKGGTITLQTPVKENAVFDGWIVTTGDATVNGNEITVNDAIVEVQAIWITRTVANGILNVDLDGGTWSGDTLIQTETNSVIKLERPTKLYYLFEGWEVVEGNAEISGDNIVVYDSKVLIKAIFIDIVPVFTYKKSDGTGANHIILSDDGVNWRIKFLESGTLKFESLGNIVDNKIDVFLVGGGGGGGVNSTNYTGGGGGGSGEVNTIKDVFINNIEYSIIIGVGGVSRESGGSTSAFGYVAVGGYPGSGTSGGAGGSGGGSGGYSNDYSAAKGGQYGNSGSSSKGNSGGVGRGVTTCEFGAGTLSSCNSGVALYASGGSGGAGKNINGIQGPQISGISAGAGAGGSNSNGANALANTGSGGGGGAFSGYAGGSGGSGIVVIRNARG